MLALDLFSGIGGMSLALHDLVTTVAYVEIDVFCQAVLRARIKDGLLTKAPIFADVKNFNGDECGKIDLILAGFPCQDISMAGQGLGLAGTRSGLFFEIMRLANKLKPSLIFLENVAGIRKRGLHTILSELNRLGYDATWCHLSAKSVGAPHQRNRFFCLAHTNDLASGKTDQSTQSDSNQQNAWLRLTRQTGRTLPSPHWTKNQPTVARMADGFSNWLDRSKALGNAVVPAQARIAFDWLTAQSLESVKTNPQTVSK